METLISVGRKFYGICIGAIGIQQLFYADFRPMFTPDSSWLPGLSIWAYLFSAALIVAGLSIIIEKRAKEVALISGGVFLFLFVFYHVPHLLFVNPYSKHLGTWTNALKELAFAGGAFAAAGSYATETVDSKSFLITWLEKLIPFGSIFFSITMIAFGISHFVYVGFVEKLVPAWIPGHIFWTYFAGVALIGSGVSIMFKIKVKEVALLLGIMIFLWFIVLHIPRAIADPFGNKGNELTSVFQALGFSGIAFVLSGIAARKNNQVQSLR
jgi:hypothetical protein